MAVIHDYYAAIDSGNLEEAVGKLSHDVLFTMSLPTGRTLGSSREDMLGYLRNRPTVERRHVIERESSDRDVTFAYGVVTDNGVITGAFSASMHTGQDGFVDRYAVQFDPDFRLVP